VEVEAKVYDAIRQFTRMDAKGKKKTPGSDLFDAFDATDLNKVRGAAAVLLVSLSVDGLMVQSGPQLGWGSGRGAGRGGVAWSRPWLVLGLSNGGRPPGVRQVSRCGAAGGGGVQVGGGVLGPGPRALPARLQRLHQGRRQ
jgi:hypothetical protein